MNSDGRVRLGRRTRMKYKYRLALDSEIAYAFDVPCARL